MIIILFLAFSQPIKNQDIRQPYNNNLSNRLYHPHAQIQQMTVPFLYKLKTNTNDHDIIDANIFSFKLMRFPSRKRKTGPYYTTNVHEKFNSSNQMFCCTLNFFFGNLMKHFLGNKKKVRAKIAWAARRVCSSDSLPAPTSPRSLRQTSCSLVPQE